MIEDGGNFLRYTQIRIVLRGNKSYQRKENSLQQYQLQWYKSIYIRIYICIYVYIYVYMYIYIYIFIYIYIYISEQVFR